MPMRLVRSITQFSIRISCEAPLGWAPPAHKQSVKETELQRHVCMELQLPD